MMASLLFPLPYDLKRDRPDSPITNTKCIARLPVVSKWKAFPFHRRELSPLVSHRGYHLHRPMAGTHTWRASALLLLIIFIAEASGMDQTPQPVLGAVQKNDSKTYSPTDLDQGYSFNTLVWINPTLSQSREHGLQNMTRHQCFAKTDCRTTCTIKPNQRYPQWETSEIKDLISKAKEPQSRFQMISRQGNLF